MNIYEASQDKELLESWLLQEGAPEAQAERGSVLMAQMLVKGTTDLIAEQLQSLDLKGSAVIELLNNFAQEPVLYFSELIKTMQAAAEQENYAVFEDCLEAFRSLSPEGDMETTRENLSKLTLPMRVQSYLYELGLYLGNDDIARYAVSLSEREGYLEK